MKQFFMLSATLCVFSAYSVRAQTSGPRKPPTAAVKPAPTETATRSNEPPATQAERVMETRTVNGLTITLKRIKGNPADQTVTLDMLITNPKGNATVNLAAAYAVDPEGDKYEDARGYGYGSSSMNEILYTDVPRKASISVRGVPAKVKALSLFKLVVYNQLSGQNVDLEYRNLNIDWQ